MMKKILIIGSGVLSTMVAQLLTWRKFPAEITIAARDISKADEIVNLIKFTCENLDHTPQINSLKIDLESNDMTAELLNKRSPDLIFNVASVQAFWMINELPPHISKTLWTAGVGPWTACHAYPVLKLMEAVKSSGCQSFVVNSAFPDAVNPMLDGIGLTPNIGIGNVSNICQPLREAASQVLNIPISKLSINMIAHHAISHTIPSYGSTKGAPYYLSIKDDHGQVLNDEQLDAKLFKFVKNDLKRKRGKEGMFVTASSAVRIIEGYFSDSYIQGHAPGIKGMIGGYPVVVGKKAAFLNLNDEISIDQAIELNVVGQKFDGIQSINNGMISIKDESVDILSALMNFSQTSYAIKDSKAVALELVSKYQELRNSYV